MGLLFLCLVVVVVHGLNVNLNVTVLADGLSWLENLSFGGAKGLFFTEALASRVWHIPSPSENFTLYLDLTKSFAMNRILGVSFHFGLEVLVGVGQFANGTNFMYTSAGEGSLQIVAILPKLGNGIGVHERTGLVYTAAEGSLFPTKSVGGVYQVDVKTGAVLTLADNLHTSDGLWIDQDRDLLYVGELFRYDVACWDISKQPPRFLGFLPGLQSGLLDDFTLNANGTSIIGANWLFNRIDVFPALPTNGTFAPSTLIPNEYLNHPTSARFGVAPFATKSLFVTEGNQFRASGTKDRLLRFDFF
jgi:hypothetical protein